MSAHTLAIPLWQLVLAAALALVPALCSAALGLGLGKKLVVGSVRMVAQLFAVGFVLTWIFAQDHPGAVALMVAWMVGAAAWTAVGRSEKRYRGVLLDTLLAIGVSSLAILFIGTSAVVRADPWWAPRYLIPILGMLLGNSMTGIALGIGTWLEGLEERKDRIESMLALGATRWEAARDGISDALRRALTPTLNIMAAAGVVSLPGMMTGQILAGNPPELAVRYQIAIIFFIAAATAIGALLSVLMAYRRLFDSMHRLRIDRLQNS